MTQTAGKITEYFGREAIEASPHAQPTITKAFLVGKGWITVGPIPATFHAVEILGTVKGTDAVMVSFDGRDVDFTIQEIKAYAERPLLGGRVI